MIFIPILYLLFIKTYAVSTSPVNYYDYSPRLIEAGKIGFVKGASPDINPSLVFHSSYTVTLQRVQTTAPTPYWVAIGFKIL